MNSGCVIRSDSGHGMHATITDNTDQSDISLETIDADQVLDTDLGQGVGLFVEYSTGGTWRLWTSCDTSISDSACDFQVHVITGAPLGDITSQGFEAGDSFDLAAADELWFYAQTGTDSDAIQFPITAGAHVQVELWVDGAESPDFVYWVGDGVVHEGAPTQPVEFAPNAA